VTGWLLATAGTAALGSVFPLVNIELYLIGVLSTTHGLSWWQLGLAAAVGQMSGKSLLYFAGQGSFALGTRLTRRMSGRPGSRWAGWLERFHDRVQQRPWWGLGVLLVSGVTSLPPFSLLCFAFGAAGVPAVGFFAVSLLGRAVHFLLVAGMPELLGRLPFLAG